jgi:hypothetical protein
MGYIRKFTEEQRDAVILALSAINWKPTKTFMVDGQTFYATTPEANKAVKVALDNVKKDKLRKKYDKA